MLSPNPFINDPSTYKRQIDPLGDYVRDNAFFLSRMTNDPYSECVDWVKRNLQEDGLFPLQDPDTLILEADEVTLDRQSKIIPFSHYLRDALKADDLIAPTYTTFYQPTVRESFQKKYTIRNKALRGVYKKEMFKHEREGDKVKADIADKKQNNRKLANNAMSGAYTIFSTPLGNPTAHAVLTSVCRVTSGYANANNEKFLAGNRHYWSPKVTMTNIVNIVTHFNQEALFDVMEKYQLHYPSIEETMECIRFSAKRYWLDEYQYIEIENLVEKLKPLERAAFVYIGDFYHLRKHNESFVRQYFTELIQKHNGEDLNVTKSDLKSFDEPILMATKEIFELECQGVDYEDLADNDPLLKKLAATASNIGNVLLKYGDFIQAFFTTTNLPASLAYFPSSEREVVLTSDTDSTIYTTQFWCEWYTHDDLNAPEADGVGAILTMMISFNIVHLLAIMSANLGIKQDDLDVIAMKNEFKFDVFIITNVSKHYAALISIREGNVYKVPKVEIKGVHMKNSNAPKIINQRAEDLLVDIMQTAGAGKKVDLKAILNKIGDEEREIIASIKSGSPLFCRRAKVKEPQSYSKGPSESPYQYHVFWNEVFGPKYGMVEEPPYGMVKLASSNLDSPNKIKTWCDSLPDKALAERLMNYCRKNAKKRLNTFYVPNAIVQSHGIPDEILDAANYRGLVKNIHTTYYIILETLGFYITDTKATRLVSDYY